MYFNTNIKILRNRRNRTQDVVANELDISRSTLTVMKMAASRIRHWTL